MPGMFRRTLLTALLLLTGAASSAPPPRTDAPLLQACRLRDVEHDALCGVLPRPLDPGRPEGTQIEVHFAVLPALARNKHPDPVFFFAGGPGQSAVELAGTVGRLLARLSNRRDLVLVDQRGTGRSASLACPELSPTLPLREVVDAGRVEARLIACLRSLRDQPHGDLRRYTTTLAMQDVEAVRRALGAERINLVGGSYGTRAALEYQRQFPQAVRRVVIDGAVPPDMVLPEAFGTDNEAALQAMFAACEAEPGCATRHPQLRDDLRRLLAALPQRATLLHPVTLRREEVLVEQDFVLSMLRTSLYRPVLASGLPLALQHAAAGRFEALIALGTSLLPSRRGQKPAEGMHFAVVCAEDLPKLQAPGHAAVPEAGGVFGHRFADYYRRICAEVPRGDVPAGFYTLPEAQVATLVTAGGIDPATPPRHGERVVKSLGPLARHLVVPQAGHGVLGIGCMRDVVFRFIDAVDDRAALAVDASCAQRIPRPPAFALPRQVVP
jgi:pimeloyl-ACP methyl ester carboxylesterase